MKLHSSVGSSSAAEVSALAASDLAALTWRNFRISSAAEPVVALALFFVICDEVGLTGLIIWSILMIGLFCSHSVMNILQFRASERRKRDKIWSNYFRASATVSAGLWGGAGAMFTGQLDPLHQSFLAVIVCGIAGATVAAASTNRWTCIILPPLILIPAGIATFAVGTNIHMTLGLLYAVYAVYLVIVGLQSYAAAWDAAVTRHEKSALATRLNTALSLAQRASEAKSQFLANMSHELRTPLNSILGFSEMMKDRHITGSGIERYVEYAAHIHHSGSHLLELINDILDTAKAEAGKLDLHEAEIDLQQVADDCFSLMQPVAVGRSVDLAWRQTAAEPLIVIADKLKIRQIMLNLLSNAVKFSRAGGHVFLFVTQSDTGLAFRVEDDGIGMTAAELDSVMEPFVQASEGWARDHGGTGLGLPLTKKYVEIHGGELIIQSERGVGTKVTVKLPVERLVPAAKTRRRVATAA